MLTSFEAKHKILSYNIDPNLKTCLFVSHSVHCRIKPHVEYHIETLETAGWQVILIINTDNFHLADQLELGSNSKTVIVRENYGFDFGAWAEVLRMYPFLWEAPQILLVNDSVIGPLGRGVALFSYLEKLDEDLIGLNESWQRGRHFQSFFLMLNSGALKSGDVRKFWNNIVNHNNKQQVINEYELKFTRICSDLGLRTKAVYRLSPLVPNVIRKNPTIDLWYELLEAGYPYIKIELVRDRLNSKGVSLLKSRINDPKILSFIEFFTKTGS